MAALRESLECGRGAGYQPETRPMVHAMRTRSWNARAMPFPAEDCERDSTLRAKNPQCNWPTPAGASVVVAAASARLAHARPQQSAWGGAAHRVAGSPPVGSGCDLGG